MIKIPKNNRSQYQKYSWLILGMLIIMTGNVTAAEHEETEEVEDEENTEKPIIFKAHNREVNEIAYSPNGKFFASTSYDGTIKLWDSLSLQWFFDLEGGTDEVRSLSFNHDGQYLASVFYPMGKPWKGSIKIWDMNTFKCTNTLNGYNIVVFHPQKNTIIIASNRNADKDTELYDIDTKKSQKLPINDISVSISKPICFNYNGQIITYFSHTPENTVKLINTLTNELIREIKFPINASQALFDGTNPIIISNISSIAFHPHKNLLAIGFANKNIKIINIETNDLLYDLTAEDRIRELAFNPKGTLLVSGNHDSITLWNVDTGENLKNIKQDLVRSITFSPDGETVLVGLWDGTIAVINVYDHISKFQFID